MLSSARDLLRLKVDATDGQVGRLKDLYFDDVSWKIRYLVIDTGGWLAGRDVLLSPETMESIEIGAHSIKTRLTQAKIESSPSADSHPPVTRQMERQMSPYYGWSPYWVVPTGLFPRSQPLENSSHGDPHLRSLVAIQNYGLRATDGDMGRLEDVLIDPRSFEIKSLVVDARNWWPGGQVLIDWSLVQNISWMDQKIELGLTSEQLKNAPHFDRATLQTDRPSGSENFL